MLRLDLARAALLLGPLLVLGFAAGVVRALARRPGLDPRRRRRLQAAWVLMLLGGAPLWLVLAAVLRIW
ncbi:MAG TPA: hypothetical protein VFL83_12390 [Anaeromyxobacter sp.]|nr:hypothetical protein [Anaeromyxobacter sp.]